MSSLKPAFFAAAVHSRNGGARVHTFQNRQESSMSESDGAENVSDDQQFDAMSIINSAFDKKASLSPQTTLVGKNARPRKPQQPVGLSRAVTSHRVSVPQSSVKLTRLTHSQISANSISPRPFNLQDDMSLHSIDASQSSRKPNNRMRKEQEAELVDSEDEMASMKRALRDNKQ